MAYFVGKIPLTPCLSLVPPPHTHTHCQWRVAILVTYLQTINPITPSAMGTKSVDYIERDSFSIVCHSPGLSFPIVCPYHLCSLLSANSHCLSFPIVCHSHCIVFTIVCHIPFSVIPHCHFPISVIPHGVSFPIVCHLPLSSSIILYSPLSIILSCPSFPIVYQCQLAVLPRHQ